MSGFWLCAGWCPDNRGKLSGALAVFPVTGWWKENKARDRSEDGARYALILSIETPDLDVDIWTPVAEQIRVPVSVTTTT